MNPGLFGFPHPPKSIALAQGFYPYTYTGPGPVTLFTVGPVVLPQSRMIVLCLSYHGKLGGAAVYGTLADDVTPELWYFGNDANNYVNQQNLFIPYMNRVAVPTFTLSMGGGPGSMQASLTIEDWGVAP